MLLSYFLKFFDDRFMLSKVYPNNYIVEGLE